MSNPMLHPESLRPVLSETARLADLFAARGRRLFLVGGAVRDLAFGNDLESVDLDFTTDAPPEEIRQTVEQIASSLWTQGEKFGTIGCVIEGRGCEITTHRKEAYDHDSRKPVVEFGKDIADDLARRDFTVNAIAIDLPAGTLVDPFDGISALGERMLATPLSAEESFSDDPLRMLRAARFVAQFNLTPTQEITAAMSEMGERLEIVSAERITDEAEKILLLEDPSAAFGLLASTGLGDRVFGESFADKASTAGKRLGQLSPCLELRLAGLLVTGLLVTGLFAMPSSLRFSKSTLRETASIADLARDWLQIGTESEDEAKALVKLRQWQMRAAALPDILQAARELAAAVAGEQGLSSQNAALERLYLEGGTANLKVPVSGNEIMERLGIPPGPSVGEAIAHICDILIQEGQMTKGEVLERAEEWWVVRSVN